MKTIKATLIMLVPILVLLCLSGCGPPNCVTVDAGRPFVAQEGMRYGVAEGGITYNFNQNAYPNAQVIYVDPGEYQTLQPGRTYVMFLEPNYLVRRKQRQEESDSMNNSINDMGKSWSEMGNMFKPK
jgi:hypothetical protein